MSAVDVDELSARIILSSVEHIAELLHEARELLMKGHLFQASMFYEQAFAATIRNLLPNPIDVPEVADAALQARSIVMLWMNDFRTEAVLAQEKLCKKKR